MLAPNRPAGVSGLWSLLGAKRTWLGHSEIDAIDPKETWSEPLFDHLVGALL